MLESKAGIIDFGWLDRVMDLLHQNRVRVDLATPTAAPWRVEKYCHARAAPHLEKWHSPLGKLLSYVR